LVTFQQKRIASKPSDLIALSDYRDYWLLETWFPPFVDGAKNHQKNVTPLIVLSFFRQVVARG